MLRYYAGIILLSIVACSSDRAPTGPAGKVAVLPEPTNLGLENLTDTSVRFVWDEVEGAADYDINYKEVGGRWTNIPHRGTALYHDFEELEPSTEYRWAVRAENRDGPSAWAFGDTFATHPDGFSAPIIDPEEEALFQRACLSIEDAIINTLSVSSQGKRKEGAHSGRAYYARQNTYFSTYSDDGEFLVTGILSDGFLGKFHVVQASGDSSFFFVTSFHPTDRRGRRVIGLRSEFVSVGPDFLYAIKGDFLDIIHKALDVSRRTVDSYAFIEGTYSGQLQDGDKGSFVHIDVEDGVASWEFDDYETQAVFIDGTLSNIDIRPEPVVIRGGLGMYDMTSETLEYQYVKIDLEVHDSMVSGTLGLVAGRHITYDPVVRWDIDDIDGSFIAHQYNTPMRSVR